MDAINPNSGAERDPRDRDARNRERVSRFESSLRSDLDIPCDFAKMEKSLLERHGIVRPRSASDPEPASSATTKAGRAEGSSNGTSRRASRPS